EGQDHLRNRQKQKKMLGFGMKHFGQQEEDGRIIQRRREQELFGDLDEDMLQEVDAEAVVKKNAKRELETRMPNNFVSDGHGVLDSKY
ncbi:unnamed protein product, partial [Amoebophrya sp. A25]